MINELQANFEPQCLYEQSPGLMSCPVGDPFDADSPMKKHHVSSICFQLKKKIKRSQNRPSILKIEESVRNVKVFINPSLTNLEKLDNDSK